MTEDTQAVVEKPDAQAKPAAEVSNAPDKGDDLDTLLSQYETETAPKPSTPDPKPEQKASTAQDPDILEVKAQLAELSNDRFRGDMDKTIAKVRGELDAQFYDDEFVEAYVDSQARKDPRLQKAWQDRRANPKQFDRVITELGRNFSKKYGKLPDKAATEDRETVAAAVRGASTRAPEGKAPDFSGMSNPEYRKTIEKEYGFDPGV